MREEIYFVAFSVVVVAELHFVKKKEQQIVVASA